MTEPRQSFDFEHRYREKSREYERLIRAFLETQRQYDDLREAYEELAKYHMGLQKENRELKAEIAVIQRKTGGCCNG